MSQSTGAPPDRTITAGARHYNPSAAAIGAFAVDPTDPVALWAEARTLYLAEDFPPYGSAPWLALHPDDPRRFAAVIDAAEKWRKYGDEQGLLQWFADAQQPRRPLADRPTRAELDAEYARCRERAAQMWARKRAELSPSIRWPRVAVPGQGSRTTTSPERSPEIERNGI